MRSTISSIIFIESFIFIIISSSLFIIWLIYELFLEEEGFEDKMKILLITIITTIIIGFGMAIPCLIIGTKIEIILIGKMILFGFFIFNIFGLLSLLLHLLSLIFHNIENFSKILMNQKSNNDNFLH
ncbi:hypothetical protein M0811_02386 [Anaeramoeba ignava]|uniref:Uncharacterized protein n=1 Tax=Anaeramoeba ignava TaxID=1746090 RepID=A0A9Q0R7Y7_ANAIG|nr:hypothetical protein M0811_02386 [Anaeramoeba ignava]